MVVLPPSSDSRFSKGTYPPVGWLLGQGARLGASARRQPEAVLAFG